MLGIFHVLMPSQWQVPWLGSALVVPSLKSSRKALEQTKQLRPDLLKEEAITHFTIVFF